MIKQIIEYTNAEQVFSERLVEPLSLSFRWYAWYLFAYSMEKQDYRLFKLSRILSCKPTDGVFSKVHGNVEELMKNKTDKRKYYHIRLLCKKEINQQVFEYLNCNLIEELGNGDFVVSMSVPFEQMWFSLLMGFGNKIQVIEPVELKIMLKQKAEEIISIY